MKKLLPYTLLIAVSAFGKWSVCWLLASNLPYVDQWEGTLHRTLLPLTSGTLHFSDLFAPYNEHRLFWTRLLDIAQFIVSGHFDNFVQCVWNALIHIGTLCLLAWFLTRVIGDRYRWWIASSCAAIAFLPFAWENTISGFQSQAYFLLLFSIPAIYLLAVRNSWWGLLPAVCSLFTLASGFVCCLAVLPFIIRRGFLASAVAAIVVSGLLLQGHDYVWPSYMAAYQHGPENLLEFAFASGRCLAWPNIFLAPLALINLLPCAVLLWHAVPTLGRLTHAQRFLFSMFAWVGLQAIAMAFARGQAGFYPPSRYGDTLALLLPLNVAALCLLHSQSKLPKPLLIGWTVPVAVGLLVLTGFSLTLDMPRRWVVNRIWLANTRKLYDGHSVSPTGYFHQVPYMTPAGLQSLIQDQRVLELMPPDWLGDGYPPRIVMRARFRSNYEAALNAGADPGASQNLQQKAGSLELP